jgi:hypothetical protein
VVRGPAFNVSGCRFVNLTSQGLGAIDEELDDLMLPYQIDLSIFHRIENMKLREHIERVGVVFYRNGTVGTVEMG